MTAIERLVYITEAIRGTHAMHKKKEQAQLAMLKFKKKYHYNPDDKTITVNGEKYKAKFNENAICCTLYSDGTKEIQLDKEFFMDNTTHGAGDRDAMAFHEIGHIKLGHLNEPDHEILYAQTNLQKSKDDLSNALNRYKNMDIPESVKEKYKDQPKILNQKIKSLKGVYRDNVKFASKMHRQHKKTYKDVIRDKGITPEREAAHKAASKYDKSNIDPHVNSQEFESDRYSANCTSEKSIKHSIMKGYEKSNKILDNNKKRDIDNVLKHRDRYPTITKNEDKSTKSKKEIKETISDIYGKRKHSLSIDAKQRMNALKDEDLKNNKSLK